MPPCAMQPGSSDHTFEKLVLIASSFSVAVASGFAASIEQINPVLAFAITPWSFVCAAVGAVATWWIHRLIFEGSDEGKVAKRKQKGLYLFAGSSLLAIFAALGLSLKGISGGKLWDVIIGVSIAILFVGIAAFFFLKMVQFLKQDEEQNSLDEE